MALTVLKNALPQSRYIDITSVTIGEPAFPGRSFGGLVFSPAENILIEGTSTQFSDDKMVVVYNVDQARDYFGSESDEVKVAEAYFGYRSPRGYSPRVLSFVHDNGEGATRFTDVCKCTDNFGGFMFLGASELTLATIKSIIVKNDENGHEHEFVISFPHEEASTGSAASEDAFVKDTNAKDFVQYLAQGTSLPSYVGTSVWLGHNILEKDDGTQGTAANCQIASAMPLAIFAAARYDQGNAAPNYMFKQFSSQQATVDNAGDADAYDEYCVNYLGLVQANGVRRAFTQQGYNVNGEAINVYANECWLRSEIRTSLLNLFLATEMVDAGEDGQALIFNSIATVAERAIQNGVIAIGKTLEEDQQTAIYEITRSNTAWRTVQDSGYYLTVDVRRVTENGKTFYKAFYLLVYSKDDAILKVEGTHNLV